MAANVAELTNSTIVLTLTEDELECCHVRRFVHVKNSSGKLIGDYLVKAMVKKKKHLRLAVGDDAAKFKQGMSVKLSSDTPEEAADSVSGARTWSNITALAHGGDVIGEIFGWGGELDYTLKPRLLVGLSYVTGRARLPTLENSSFKTSEFSLTGNMLLLQARYFIFSSFNIGTSVGQRRLSSHMQIVSKFTTDQLTMNLQTTSTVLGITVGNHWTWANGLTLGCDWLGYDVPISSRSTSVTTAGGNTTQAGDVADFANIAQASAEKIGKTPNDQLLVVALGWMF